MNSAYSKLQMYLRTSKNNSFSKRINGAARSVGIVTEHHNSTVVSIALLPPFLQQRLVISQRII